MSRKSISLFLLFLLFVFVSYSGSIEKHSGVEEQLGRFLDLAENQKNTGDFEGAFEHYLKAYDFAARLDSFPHAFAALTGQGRMLWQLGLMDESQEVFSKALSVAQNHGKKEDITRALETIQAINLYQEGKQSRKTRDYDASIEQFCHAVSLFDSLGSEELTIKCLRQMSLSYLAQNNLRDFYALNKQALALAEKYIHLKEQINCLLNIGIYSRKTDNLSNALICYEKALHLAEDQEILDKISACLNNIGIIYKDLGNYEKAIQFLEKALKIDEELANEVFIAIDLINLGETIRLSCHNTPSQNGWTQALGYFTRALELTNKHNDETTGVRILNNIGATYSDLKENEKALLYFNEAYQKAKEINDFETMGMSLNNLGVVYNNLGETAKSNDYFDKAIALATRFNQNSILWESYLESGNNHKKQNNIDQAILLYAKSIDIIENIRSQIDLEENRAKYLASDKRMDAYFNIIDSLYEKHSQSQKEKTYLNQAFHYMEKAKARAFLDSLTSTNFHISKEIDHDLLDQERRLERQFSILYTKLLSKSMANETTDDIEAEIRSLENQQEKLKRRIRQQSRIYADLRYPRIISLEQTQNQLLARDTALIAYVLGRESSYLFAIKSDGQEIVRLPGKTLLNTIVKRHLSCITDYDNDDFTAGEELYSILFKDVSLADVNHLIIIPDDILHFLPFETLRTHDDRWLVEGHSISYAPSISSLNEIKRDRKRAGNTPNKDFLGLGNPSLFRPDSTQAPGNIKNIFLMNNLEYNNLKYSGIEVDRIGSIFKKKKTLILKEERANEDAFKRSNVSEYKIIHFASHAIINNIQPERSSILLSVDNNPEEDGLLQTREIYNLRLNADLVTISSCNSGLGKLTRGEGIEGLNRAFYNAGASALLMSQWAVSDQATYLLMEKFYLHLNKSRSINDALKRAKLEFIKSTDFSHPYYWAGFIVSGDTDRIIFKSKPAARAALCVVLSLIVSLISLILVKKHT
jgi:CHAT domain-containing protein